MYKALYLSDGSGRIKVHRYSDSDGPRPDDDVKPGDYIRVFGNLREWQGVHGVSAHHIVKVEGPNEIAYHTIEVAHVHLASTGRLVKAPVQIPNAASSRPPAMGAANSAMPPAGGAAPPTGGMFGGAASSSMQGSIPGIPAPGGNP